LPSGLYTGIAERKTKRHAKHGKLEEKKKELERKKNAQPPTAGARNFRSKFELSQVKSKKDKERRGEKERRKLKEKFN